MLAYSKETLARYRCAGNRSALHTILTCTTPKFVYRQGDELWFPFATDVRTEFAEQSPEQRADGSWEGQIHPVLRDRPANLTSCKSSVVFCVINVDVSLGS